MTSKNNLDVPLDDDDIPEDLEKDIEEGAPEDEEEGEDLFDDQTFEKDYQYDPNEDINDPDLVDTSNTELAEISVRDRLKVDELLNQRDREEMERNDVRRRRMFIPSVLNDAPSSEALLSDISIPEVTAPMKETALTAGWGTEATPAALLEQELQDGEEEDDMDNEDLEPEVMNMKGPLREWLVYEKPRKYVCNTFKKFLHTYSNGLYVNYIKKLVSDELESLEVKYTDLSSESATLAIWVVDAPNEMIKILDEVATAVVFKFYPMYKRVRSEIHVRISALPSNESLRELRQSQLNTLIKVTGVITRRTAVYPQMVVVKFDCSKCGSIVGPLVLNTLGNNIPKPSSCPQCQSKGPFSINQSQTLHRNYQKITLQESPGSVPPGRIPRSKEIIVLNDLIDAARPGEEVEVTGVYTHNYDAGLNKKQGFPVFATVIYANHICKIADKLSSFALTEDDKKQIAALSKEPDLHQKIVNSIAPSIYGHEDIKLAMALALFGGQSKDIKGKHRVRGDINVLLVGDPGTAKSQFLKYVEKTAHRAVYTTGKGSTAVGLTAAVRKDPITGEWMLEGGALVLADNGTCLIDEFDKMNDKDRTSIHEAMEQQTISISKAGIVTTLQARCSVIAAANPTRGRYDPSRTFHDNVDLTDAILSRFDILCVVKDTVDPEDDERLAGFVVESHTRSHPKSRALEQAAMFAAAPQSDLATQDEPTPTTHTNNIIPQSLLKKYIIYAKQTTYPHLNTMDQEKLTQFYTDLRRESVSGGGIPITVRHIESAVRLAEAHARMNLREYVREDDVNTAISVLLRSFISSQKYAVSKGLNNRLRKYVFLDRSHFDILLHILNDQMKQEVNTRALASQDDAIQIPFDSFKARVANGHQIFTDEILQFFKSEAFKKLYSFDEKKKVIQKHMAQ